MKLLAIDIECATHYVRGSICSFGYVLFDLNENSGGVSLIERTRRDIIINPVCRISDKHCKLAYEKTVYRAAADFRAVHTEIVTLLQSADIVVGHAIANDIRFLEDACARYNLKMPAFRYICTQTIYKEFTKSVNTVSIETVTSLLNLPDLTLHKSVDDAYVCGELLRYILKASGKPLNALLYALTMVTGEYSPGRHVRQFDGRKNRDLLFEEYTARICKPLQSRSKKERRALKKYCFDNRIIQSDIDYSRSLVYSVIKAGFLYIREKEFGLINYFVIPDNEPLTDILKKKIDNANRNGGKISVITEKELLTAVPYIRQYFDNDFDLIRRLSS